MGEVTLKEKREVVGLWKVIYWLLGWREEAGLKFELVLFNGRFKSNMKVYLC